MLWVRILQYKQIPNKFVLLSRKQITCMYVFFRNTQDDGFRRKKEWEPTFLCNQLINYRALPVPSNFILIKKNKKTSRTRQKTFDSQNCYNQSPKRASIILYIFNLKPAMFAARKFWFQIHIKTTRQATSAIYVLNTSNQHSQLGP